MKRYIPLILIEGATVMAVELCGAKQLAPLYGGSLFVWAAILAVTLSALAFGYYYGGVLSSRSYPEKKLSNVIILASVCIILMPFMALYIIPPLSYLNFKFAVILSATLLIFLPIFFLGCTTPLLVRINTISTETSGLISGKIYAISTVGGIISTLLCGFYLIPNLGLKLTLICFAVLLFVIASLTLKVFKANTSIPFLIVMLVTAKSMMGNDDGSVKYFSYGIMGDVAVKDENSIRKLFINRTVQTEMDLATKRSVSNYVRCMDSIIPKQEKTKNALVLGLGGGLLANLIQQKNFNVDAVEFDPRVIEIAKNYFYLDPKVRCFSEDARAFLNERPGLMTNYLKYDQIILDLFKAEEQPAHVITVESLMRLKTLMNPAAKMIINWHGYMDGELGKGTVILLNTLHKAGLNTQTIPGPGGEDHRNIIIVCAEDPKIYSNDNELVNTDDKPLLELANAKANLRWRRNYLKFYQQSN